MRTLSIRSLFLAVSFGTLVGVVGCAGVSRMSVDEVRKLDNASICYLNATQPVGFVPLEFDRRSRDAEHPLDCRNYEEEILAVLQRSDVTTIPSGMLNQRDCASVTLGEKLMSQTTKGESVLGTWKFTSSGSYRRVKNNRRATVYVLFSVSDNEGRAWKTFMKFPPNHEDVVQFNRLLSGPVDVSIIGCKAIE